ncbi:MAG: hypothetical protein ACE5GE_16050 [Phycisphaerae bacterium]
MHQLLRSMVLGVAMVFVTGCDDSPPGPTPQEQSIERLNRELQREHHRRELDTARHRVELSQHDSDLRGALLIWLATSLALFMLMLLLVRERRARRILERIVRLLLGHHRGGRDPPN